MERLKSACLLALLAFASQVALGQQTTSNEPQAGSVAVIGDVEHCEVYVIPEGQAISVQQAVRRAGPLSDMVRATVIRAGHDGAQWTQLVSPTSSDNGEQVTNGDVLVVQSLTPVTTGFQKNAALRTDTSVLVVGLTQEGIVIGDVLQQTNNLRLGDGQLKVISRFQGQKTIDRAELHLPVAHGDVVSISRNSRTVESGFGNMTPAHSEWQGAATTASRDLFIPQSAPSAGEAVQSPAANPHPFQFPALPTEPLFPPIPDDSNSGLGAENQSQASDDSTLTSIQPVDITDPLPPENKIRLASETTTLAPTPPMEVRLNEATESSAAINPWNLVFIGGLLLAGTLILAGTMKADPADDDPAAATIFPQQTALQAPAQSTAPAHSASVAAVPVIRAAVPVIQAVAGITEPLDGISPSQIRSQEWFSTDWHRRSVASDVSSTVESRSNAPAETFASETSMHEKTTLPEFASVKAAGEKSAPQSSMTSESASVKNQPLPANEEVRRELSDTDFSDLEDLLQNRLPIDLCQTQLPLRIALFGKPAGPRRLRIDAAHATTPAPHINLSADKRREGAVTTAASQSSPTQNAGDATGSLDRALHFLQERTTT